MVWVVASERIEVETVASWFDEIDQDLTSPFNWQKADGTILTIKDFFKSQFKGLLCRYKKGEELMANIKFHQIFSDHIFEALKVKKFKEEIVKDLQNWDLYQDEVKTKYKNLSDNTNATSTNQQTTNLQERDLIDGNLSGSSDAATMGRSIDKTDKVIATRDIINKSPNKLLDYMHPNVRQMSQSVTIQAGNDKHTNQMNYSSNITNKGNTTGDSFVASSNPLKDRLTFLGISVPSLISGFLDNFRIMFHT